MSLLKYFIAMLFALLLFSACKTLEVGVERPRSPLATSTVRAPLVVIDPGLPATGQMQLTATPSPMPAPKVYAGTPQPGTLYLGNHDGTVSLFFRSRNSTEDPGLGMIVYTGRKDILARYSFDFEKFSHPRVVLTGESRFVLFDAARDDWTKFVYVSYLTDCPPPADDAHFGCNRLLEVSYDTLAHHDIWAYDLSSDVYPEFHGPAVIDQVAGPRGEDGRRFLVLRLMSCYACGPALLGGMLVLNAQTGKELYLGKVGNVSVDFIENVVSYQSLGTQRIKCDDPNPLCDPEGYMTLYEPTGDLLKQPLP